jgi:hypothetical protein
MPAAARRDRFGGHGELLVDLRQTARHAESGGSHRARLLLGTEKHGRRDDSSREPASVHSNFAFDVTDKYTFTRCNKTHCCL